MPEYCYESELNIVYKPVSGVHFLKFLAVNLGSDALVRSQKVVTDDNNGRTRNSRHIVPLVLKIFGSFIMIKTLNQFLRVVI